MILSKPYQEKFDAGILAGKIETIKNMLDEGCEWDFIKKITGVSRSQYEKLRKKK